MTTTPTTRASLSSRRAGRHGSADEFRRALRVLSRPAIDEVCRGVVEGVATRGIRHFVESGAIYPCPNRFTALGELHKWLGRHYRAETLFKNAVANNILFGRHSPSTTAMLQEFRVGRSKADCVIVNGEVEAFEIKTELDSPARLRKQLADYQSVFPKVSVLTDERLADRYIELLGETPIGVVALARDRARLSVRRPATADPSGLSVEAMMRSLRKSEYAAVVERATGARPIAPSALFFTSCLAAVRDADPTAIHTLWAEQLRNRKLLCPEQVGDERVRPIRHVCVDINPDADKVGHLHRWLEGPV